MLLVTAREGGLAAEGSFGFTGSWWERCGLGV